MRKSIAAIFRRCEVILNYIKSRSQEKDLDFIFADFDEILISTFKADNLKGMLMLQKDLEAWAKTLPSEDKIKLDSLIEGDSIYYEQELLLNKILKNRKIDSRKDFLLLIEALKDLNEKDKHYKYLSTLEELISDYRKSHDL